MDKKISFLKLYRNDFSLIRPQKNQTTFGKHSHHIPVTIPIQASIIRFFNDRKIFMKRIDYSWRSTNAESCPKGYSVTTIISFIPVSYMRGRD